MVHPTKQYNLIDWPYHLERITPQRLEQLHKELDEFYNRIDTDGLSEDEVVLCSLEGCSRPFIVMPDTTGAIDIDGLYGPSEQIHNPGQSALLSGELSVPPMKAFLSEVYGGDGWMQLTYGDHRSSRVESVEGLATFYADSQALVYALGKDFLADRPLGQSMGEYLMETLTGFSYIGLRRLVRYMKEHGLSDGVDCGDYRGLGFNPKVKGIHHPWDLHWGVVDFDRLLKKEQTSWGFRAWNRQDLSDPKHALTTGVVHPFLEVHHGT